MRPATPELVELARTFIAAGHVRDTELVASISEPPEADAPFTIASGPGLAVTLEELLGHLAQVPPFEPIGSEPTGYMTDEMAWLVDYPRIPIPGIEPIQIRVTVILWRTDAGWKVAHAHLSEGVPHDV